MEFLVTMTTHVPDGTPAAAVDDIRARESAHTSELAARGHVLRLWRPPLAPGEWRTLGLFAAADSAELERVLGSHDLVDTVVVVGKAHPEWGETPVAVVVPRGDVDTAALEAELRDLSRAQLGSYKQPREYVFRSEVPLGPAGKVLKREIKATLADTTPPPP